MKRKINIIGLTLFFTLTLFSFVFSEESITITTYYPSPYGSYNELYVASKVGIGTTTVDQRLDVYAPGAGATVIKIKADQNNYPNAGLNNLGGIQFAVDGAGASRPVIGEIRAFQDSGYYGLRFLTYRVGGLQDSMIVDKSGNVGIGTASPAQKLDVAGYIKAQHPFFIASSPDCWRAGSGWNTVVHTQVIAGNSGGWYNTGNGRFTAPVRGLYFFTAQHYVYSYASGAPYIHHLIGVNGDWNGSGDSSVYGSYTIFGQSVGQYDSSTSTTTLLYLNANDYVNDNVYVSTAEYNYMCGYHSFFQGVLLYAQ